MLVLYIKITISVSLNVSSLLGDNDRHHYPIIFCILKVFRSIKANSVATFYLLLFKNYIYSYTCDTKTKQWKIIVLLTWRFLGEIVSAISASPPDRLMWAVKNENYELEQYMLAWSKDTYISSRKTWDDFELVRRKSIRSGEVEQNL